MKILCILNPIAGGGRAAKRVLATLQDVFREAGCPYDLATTQQAGDGACFAANAVKVGYDVIVAIGGDGTVNEVAGGLVNTPAVLGIIPVGSGNGLARGLHIPLLARDACRVILDGADKKIDVGQVAGRYFFATSGIGFDAQVGKVYHESPGHGRGLLMYFQFGTTEFFRYEPQEVHLTCNGKTFRYTPFVLTVANVEQYGGGAIIAPGAVPDDGLFDVVILPRMPALEVLWHLPKLFTGMIDLSPYFKSHRAAALTITRAAAGPVHTDGEPFTAGATLAYTLLPRALNVRVPNSK